MLNFASAAFICLETTHSYRLLVKTTIFYYTFSPKTNLCSTFFSMTRKFETTCLQLEEHYESCAIHMLKWSTTCHGAPATTWHPLVMSVFILHQLRNNPGISFDYCHKVQSRCVSITAIVYCVTCQLYNL